MAEELVTVTIDGMPVSVPKGTTIIEAAKQAGVLVPHYCYHPSLPSPAVCRMCLVEVEKAPKLMPACVTAVAEGQVVHVDSEKAKKAREGVLELLLINHPLDCPICDQAGECELQDYVFQEGRSGTRYADYAKRYSPVEDFGPDVLYVPNRCILVHPLRSLHGGRGGGAGAQCLGAGRPGLHRDLDRAAARPSLGRQRGGPLPGGIAHLEGLPPQGAGLGPRQDSKRLPRLHPGLQHHHRHPGRHRRAAPSPAQPGGESPLHVRLRPGELPLAQPGRPDRGAPGAGGRPARRHRLGHGARPAGPAGARDLRVGRDPGLRPSVHRIARAGPADARPAQRDRRGAGPDRRGGSAGGSAQPGAAGRAGPQSDRRRAAGLRLRLAHRPAGAGERGVGDRAGCRPVAVRSGPDRQVSGQCGRHGDAFPRRPPERGAGPSDHDHGGGERHLRESGSPDPALQSGQVAAGHGAAGLVGGRRSHRRPGTERFRSSNRRSGIRAPGRALAGVRGDDLRRHRVHRAGSLRFARRSRWQACFAGGGCRDPRDEGVSAAQHHQDAGGVHGHHGGRGAADPDGAKGERLDAEPARPQPGRAGRTASARRRRAEEHSQGRDLPGAGQPSGSSCWRRPCRSFRRCCCSR